jgi:hypothetical protein
MGDTVRLPLAQAKRRCAMARGFSHMARDGEAFSNNRMTAKGPKQSLAVWRQARRVIEGRRALGAGSVLIGHAGACLLSQQLSLQAAPVPRMT